MIVIAIFEPCFFFCFSKRALLLNNIPAMIGSLMMFSSYYAKGPALLIIGRFVFGFNNGMYLLSSDISKLLNEHWLSKAWFSLVTQAQVQA